MRRSYFHLGTAILVLSVFALASSCTLTRWVPEDEFLLMDNTVQVQPGTDDLDGLNAILKQKPNRRVLGFGPRLYLQIYNLGRPDAEKGLGRLWTNIGESPVILDSALVEKTARQMGIFMFNKGYFENMTSYEIIPQKGQKRAVVRYDLYPGPRYRIDSLSRDVRTAMVEDEILRIERESLVHTGAAYDAEVLDKERERIVEHLRNVGYFAFPKERIHFEADTNRSEKKVHLHMRIDDRVFEIRDSVFTLPHHPWTISRVLFDDQYSLEKEGEAFVDSTVFDGYEFLYRTSEPAMKERVPIDATHFRPGDIYRTDRVRESYRHLVGLKVFQSIDISFKPDPRDSNMTDLVALLRLSPMPLNTFTTELKGTNTAGNFGIGGGVGLIKRNLTGRGELLNISLRGAIEAQYNSRYSDDFFNTRELGAEIGLELPKFLVPFNSYGLVPKRMRPSSSVAFETLWQERAEYTRILFNTRLAYSWYESAAKHHMITLADWRYTNVQKIDPNFYNDLQFKNGFESVVSIGSKYTFSFNEQVTRPKGNFRSFIGNFEAVGSGVSQLLDQQDPSGTDASTVFGVRATQYLRFDADFAYFWKLPEGQSIVSRIYFGLLYAMGNGRYILPFDKSFFGGGTNDNRAWPAYRLGPGGYRNSAGNVNIAPLKIMGNIEYRFPIVRALKSALFLDVGNIWIIQPDLPVYAAFRDLNETQFAFSTFMDQMAIGLGSGLRYDVGFFVVRLDLGWPLRYPFDPGGERGKWLPRPLSWNELTYNIGIGYPF